MCDQGFGLPSLVFGSASTPAASTTITSSGVAENESAEDFVPTADFVPAVPLPELIVVKTGKLINNTYIKKKMLIYKFYNLI